MKFLINIDCLGTYDVESIKEKILESRGGGVFSNKFKMARAQNLDGSKIC